MPMIWNCNVLWSIRVKFYLPIILSLLFSSCAALKTDTAQLYDAYNKLSQEVKNGEIVLNRSEYFTTNYLKEVNPNDKNSLLLLKLSNYIYKDVSHYQIFNNNMGCLSINGIDKNNEPLSLHVEYNKKNDAWLVNYVFLSFIENRSAYTKEAICPRDVEKSILDKMQ